MKIAVCVKQVAALGDEVEFTGDGRAVDPDYLEPALNEWDSFATEEALRIREAAGDDSEVVVFSVVDVDTPALVTIQTGINEPRYATLRAIKQAEQKQIDVVAPGELGEPAYRIRRMFVPPKGEGAEIIRGSASEVAQKIAEIVKER